MGNYKFYTPPMLAECLLGLVPQKKYNNIIDICCGSWNLLEAARGRFGLARYVGVDIDKDAEKNCFENAVFICEDGRKFALKEKQKYDLILSNPPFGYLKDEDRVFNKLGNSKKILETLNNKRYENEMMQANLLLAEDAGVFLFILPATFFEGDTYLNIRKELCNNYTIDSIIKLPIETFGSSKINTFALIMTNCGQQQQSSKLQEVICKDNVWEVKFICDITVDKMREGVWIGNKKNKDSRKNIVIFRGNISSAQMSKTGTKVFHSSSIIKGGVWEPSIRYCNDSEKIQKAKVVMPGDIIINRVGRYANYWCISKEKGIVSDCLIVIKASQKMDIYNSLIKNSINGKLNISTRGVTTKYITIRDIFDLL